jgi:hypothetical protein
LIRSNILVLLEIASPGLLILEPLGRPGSRSERGTRVTALLYSLIESAKLARVEPPAYRGEAARRGVRYPGAVTFASDLK